MANELVFIVDQDPSHCNKVTLWLQAEGFQTKTIRDTELCLNILDQNPAAICLDLNIKGSSGLSGLEFLKRLRIANRDIPIMVVTDNNDLNSAVETMKLGAFDYIVKPVDRMRLISNIERAIEMHAIVHKIDRLRGEMQKTHVYKNIVGQSEKIRHVFDQIEEVSGININVFIQGESGTGKELVAKAVHYSSTYKTGPFIAINCGAIPEALQESEFFGHEKGSFTGADHSRIGKLEYANHGTLFLDEVGEMSQNMQVKLLRFLQDKTFERVGGNKKISVDLRIISATNRKLENDIKNGKFREDLYYRLVVYPITIPALREHKEDIPLLVTYFLKKYKKEMPKIITTVSAPAMQALMEYDWQGNIRQLENVIYRAMVTTRTETIEVEDLYMGTRQDDIPALETPAFQEKKENATLPTMQSQTRSKTIKELEKNALIEALKITEGNVEQAAKRLDLSRATIYRKIKKYKIQ
jgi:DNA-binding NtrC family response regulator